MAQLVQKFIVEDADKASSILPQHVALVSHDGKPLVVPKKVANPGADPTVESVVQALVDSGIMEAQ
ncbi:MAG: hypothetical protein U0N89_07225 [Collinsella intestinalis]